MVRNLQAKLDLYDAPIAFVGGNLERDNRLTEVLMRRLHLKVRPSALYPPSVGAAILAAQNESAE
jgi:hypothetical protein